MADIQIDRATLEAAERGDLMLGAGPGGQDLSWLGYETLDDADEIAGMAKAAARRARGDIPLGAPRDLPDLGRLGATESYVDESEREYCGRTFTLIRADGSYDDSYERWLAVQDLGANPYTLLGRHHTAAVHGKTAKDHAIIAYDYYVNSRGWSPWGKGPHDWMREMPDGSVQLYIGWHPRRDGYHIAFRNHRSRGLEVIGNFDSRRPSLRLMEAIRVWTWVSALRVGATVVRYLNAENNGVDGGAKWQGPLFHRHGPGVKKSCPGDAVTLEWERGIVEKPWPEPVAPAAPLLRDTDAGRALPVLAWQQIWLVTGAVVRAAPSTVATVLGRGAPFEARALGRIKASDWLLANAHGTLGYVHVSGLARNAPDIGTLPVLGDAPAYLPDGGNARRAANADSPIALTGPKDDVRAVGVLATSRLIGGSGRWYACEVAGRIAYVHDSILRAGS